MYNSLCGKTSQARQRTIHRLRCYEKCMIHWFVVSSRFLANAIINPLEWLGFRYKIISRNCISHYTLCVYCTAKKQQQLNNKEQIKTKLDNQK